MEFFRADLLARHDIPSNFVQDNMSFSKKNVIRGMHLQMRPYQQAKLVTVLSGKVMDVVADLRPGSATFGEVYYCLLDAKKRNMLFVPEGFAHGFAALEDSLFFYKCSNVYSREHEIGVVWNDPKLKIKWDVENPIISTKDNELPTLDELLRNSVISRQ